MMGLHDELGYQKPFGHRGHEALLNIVLTGEILKKEGQKILSPFGITDAQFNVLMLLNYQSEDGRLNQTELGNMLLVNRSNVTGLIDRMEKTGLVRRVSDEYDRRINLVEITPEGSKIMDSAQKAYFSRIDKIMADLSDSEKQNLCSFMEMIRKQVFNGGK